MNNPIKKDYEKKYKSYFDLIEKNLYDYLPMANEDFASELNEAQQYSLRAGGKRIRPILLLATCEMLNGDLETAIPFACAIEYIHTYSLIHDDLPAMDDDDLRRGKPTNHKVFGEAMAILAGDALLTSAAQIMAEAILDFTFEDDLEERKERSNSGHIIAMQEILEAAGASGMVSGQAADLKLCNGSPISDEKLADTIPFTYYYKTARLIQAAVLTGYYIAPDDGTSDSEIESIEVYLDNITNFGEALGYAFQLRDDILDIEGKSETTGKPCGSDQRNNKFTFIQAFGMAEAKKVLVDMTNRCLELLDEMEDNGNMWFLRELTRRLSVRDK